MRIVSMATRTELVEAISERYRSADQASKGRVLDEFVAVTGFTASMRCDYYGKGPWLRHQGFASSVGFMTRQQERR